MYIEYIHYTSAILITVVCLQCCFKLAFKETKKRHGTTSHICIVGTLHFIFTVRFKFVMLVNGLSINYYNNYIHK